jgi:hypothetical protein
MDAFLDGVHEKKVSDEIKQRNKEKKPISQNATFTTYNERKMDRD